MNHWATILDIVEQGIEGDKVKCRAYAELWLEKLQADGETRIAQSLQRILEGRRGKELSPCVDIEDPAVQACLLAHSEQRMREDGQAAAFYDLMAESQ